MASVYKAEEIAEEMTETIILPDQSLTYRLTESLHSAITQYNTLKARPPPVFVQRPRLYKGETVYCSSCFFNTPTTGKILRIFSIALWQVINSSVRS